MPIHDIRDFRAVVRRLRITIAVIAVPAHAAQAVVNTVVAAGVRAVLNFSPGTLKVPPDVKLKSMDLTVSLESLSFFLAQGRPDSRAKDAHDRRKASWRSRAPRSRMSASGGVRMVDVGARR